MMAGRFFDVYYVKSYVKAVCYDLYDWMSYCNENVLLWHNK